jgi:hypothetical protein
VKETEAGQPDSRTGPYIVGTANYSLLGFSYANTEDSGDRTNYVENAAINGPGAGGGAGYSWQLTDTVYAGLEADYLYGGATFSFNGQRVSVVHRWGMSLTTGYHISRDWALTGRVGYRHAYLDLPRGSESAVDGFVAGFAPETRISGPVSLRTELSYSRFENFDVGLGEGIGRVASRKLEMTDLYLSLIYRF